MEDRSNLLLGVGLVLRRMRELAESNEENQCESLGIQGEAQELQELWDKLMVKVKGVDPRHFKGSNPHLDIQRSDTKS